VREGSGQQAGGRGKTLGSLCPVPRARRLAPRLLTVALSVGTALGCDDDDGRRLPAPVDVGRPAPAYRTVSATGDSVSLESLRGKPVLLNVWATWCHPCRDEIPELQRLYDRYRERGLELVGVSVDAAGHDDAVRAFARQYGMTYRIWRDPHEHVSARFVVVGVPATFLIDRSGVLRWKKTGPIAPSDTTLTAAIEQAVEVGTTLPPSASSP
jgi:cytochrome c biogenesis protein CcmG, thiol:disulfide interchange protein DsbE